MIIERKQYLNELIKKKDNGRIKIITGIRRCGKSYLLFKLYKDYLLGNGIKKEQIIEMESRGRAEPKSRSSTRS